MTREQITCEALKLLAPPEPRRDECRRDIEAMLNWAESKSQAAHNHKVFGSKKGKAGLRRYLKALRDLKAAYDKLDPAIKPWFSLSETAFIAGQTTVIGREIGRAGLFLKITAQPKRSSIRAQAAVEAAHSLLVWWGHKAKKTRDGKWERLAKAFGGGAAVFRHMLEIQRPIDKVKARNGALYLNPVAPRPRIDPGTR